MTTSAWWRDFRYDKGALEVRKTGIRVPVEPGVVGEFLAWLAFHGRIEAERLKVRRDGPKVWFAPDQPRPWYLIWPVFELAGLRHASDPQSADIGFCFEDLTEAAAPCAPAGLTVLNRGCTDVSKSRVAQVFEQVFGRALGVDPETWRGPMVAKSELNGVHDGRIQTGPTRREPGLAYQRLIQAVAEDGCVEDLRCPTVGGDVPVVFLKRRPASDRFANHNSEVRLLDPDAVFSKAERAQIARFCEAMKLDWGGIDVLRDRATGELWIVDVNKTDMGPPIALPMKDKVFATRKLAAALRGFIETQLVRSGACV